MITLGELFPASIIAVDLKDRRVQAVTGDSRAVREGTVFFAVPGAKAHGLTYAGDAVAKGALAIVAEHAPGVALGDTALILVPDARAALSRAAATLNPRQPGTIVAVTGTSGKTSVASFVQQIWTRIGVQAASIGTLGLVSPAGSQYGTLTTPDPVSLHQTLARLSAEGVTHVAMEASSHGLDQRRLDGVRLAAGAFTNLSRDHLDYHSSFETYLAAKLRLFEELLRAGQPAVIDADSESGEKVVNAARLRGLELFTTGVRGVELRLVEARPDGSAMLLTISRKGVDHHIRLPLAGLFQAENALVAAGLCIATGSDDSEVLAALEHLKGAPGRLEHVGSHDGGEIFIDYAHKPGALETVLEALRPFVRRNLIVVFGCGGDRDAGKRPIMGEIAARLADIRIITDDNPRAEDPAAIRHAIHAGSPGAMEIGDRAQAIRHAIGLTGEGDVLVIAGKGHETGQIVKGVTLPFSDHEAVAAVLKDGSA